MVFYNPFTTEMGNIPTIVYPARGVEVVFDRCDKGFIEKYLHGLWSLHSRLISPETEYMLAMVWDEPIDEQRNKMTDLWTHRRTADYGFGPLMDVLTFRNNDHYFPDQSRKDVPEGRGSGNTIKVVSNEEQLWTELISAGGTPQEFLSGPRPKLPERMRVGEDFYFI